MGREQRREGESLRRLHQPQRVAIERLVDQTLRIDALDGVGHRQSGDRRPGALGGRDRARDQLTGSERPRRVVDKHDIRRTRAQRFQAGTHRGLPGGAAECWRKHRHVGGGGLEKSDILGVNNRQYAADVLSFYEHGQRPPQHDFATDLPELLGQFAARAHSAPGGDNDGGDVRHGW